MQRGPPWHWRWRKGGPGRPPKPRAIWKQYDNIIFYPYTINGEPAAQGEPIVMLPDELEALRLVYYEGLSQEEAAKLMGISRGTLWRLLSNGRRKAVEALVLRRPLMVSSS